LPPRRIACLPTSFPAPLSIDRWPSTPTSKPPDAGREVFGIRLKEIVLVLEEENGELLLAFLNIETEAVLVTGGRDSRWS